MTDSGLKYAWVIYESKAVQIHIHNSHRCLHVPRVSGSVKIPHDSSGLITWVNDNHVDNYLKVILAFI